ncbi:MAG: S-methyl-5-thioribose-1-phosphate isomerase, partial [Gammaproteobacteria bacterium]
PTAVNLRWAIQRMARRLEVVEGDPFPELLEEALAIHREDIEANRRMGRLGAGLIEGNCRVLTHCNTGALATGGFGTALGVIRSAYAQGKVEHVYATETRPFLQGARLTAWELAREAIPATLLVDSAAALLMKEKGIAWLIVGADRIAANGDVANKIGTYPLALAARRHGVKCMVVAPLSTFDSGLPDGSGIPIEHRPPEEVLTCRGRATAPAGVAAWNPAFDITPAELVDAYVTEQGIARNPSEIRALLQKAPHL